MSEKEDIIRVLSLDGGGMRGVYSATYLKALSNGFAKQRGVENLDIGAGFDLIVGTSTGGILACALAAGVSLPKVISLYREEGPNIFQSKIPNNLGLELGRQMLVKGAHNRSGAQALRSALGKEFGGKTLQEIYEKRGIALAIPAVNMNTHAAWVFKTAHIDGSNHRDDDYTLVEVCMATSAAPIFRSLEAIDNPGDNPGFKVFADGGLWANNPILVALLDALRMSDGKKKIEIYALGTCPKPTGESIDKDKVHRGILGWNLGGKAAELSIDAQEFAFDHMARMFGNYVASDCEIIRFPSDDVPPDDAQYLGLDETSEAGMNALVNLALRDVDLVNGMAQDLNNEEGQLIKNLFMKMPVAQEPKHEGIGTEL